MDYHEDTSHLTKTALTVFVQSRQEYYHQFVAKDMPRRESTQEMIAGTVLHAMFLEGKSLDDLVGVYPESCINKNGGLIGANTKKYREVNPGLFWMKGKDRDRLETTFVRLRETAIGEAIAACSQFEHEWRAKIYGKACKCRTDIAGDMGTHWVVYDLKFTETIGAFVRSSRTLKYWLQDAHYTPIIAESVRKPVVFKFIAAETVYPFRVRIHSYNEIKREMAAKFHKSQVIDLMNCERTGDWSDLVEEDLPLSEWDVSGAGEVLFEDVDFDAINAPVEKTEEMEMPF